MKKSRFTETQIVKILKEVEAGRTVKEVCREYGIVHALYFVFFMTMPRKQVVMRLYF